MREDTPAPQDKPAARNEPRNEPLQPVAEKIGMHPISAAAGAAGGAVVGAAIGIAAGPVGSLVGAVGGAVLGGVLASSTGGAPVIDTSEHEAHWRERFASLPYAAGGAPWDDYEPAFRYGTQAYARSAIPRTWEEVEADMAAGWEAARGGSRLSWDEAKPAVRDAWNRMRGEGPSDEDVGVTSPS